MGEFAVPRCSALFLGESSRYPSVARVPQVSYNAPLLEALNLPDLRLSAIGFADDINPLTYGESTAVNCIALETAHDQCLHWAATHGMQFALHKYTLTHFTRRSSFDLAALVRINDIIIAPMAIVRILGVQLDSELRWKAHTEAVSRKMETQINALCCTVASTWGATTVKARQIYLTIVRTAIS